MHYTAMSETHHVGRAALISTRDIEWHLHHDHGVYHNSAKTKGQLGRLHLLVHAVLADDNLRQLLNLPEGYGTGTQTDVQH